MALVQRVAEVFRRFDVNGDGKVSKQELAFVLKTIDPVVWDDIKINNLLKAADKNNDGVLDYKEFLKWITSSKDGFDDWRKEAIFRADDVFTSADLVYFNQGHVDNFYGYGQSRRLGDGAFGSVYMAKQLATGAIRARKDVSKKTIRKEALAAEIELTKTLDHMNIVKLYEVFEDKYFVSLIIELCEGGDLFDAIVEVGFLQEWQAASVMKQVMEGLAYMHRMRICHRDIKPENLMLKDKAPIGTAKIKFIDFGSATKVKQGEMLTHQAGSKDYVAPEVLNKCYDHACDVWSCGVLLYILLCGYPPFSSPEKSDKYTFSNILNGWYEFHPEFWDGVSTDAKDLVKRMLTVDSTKRIEARQCSMHSWLEFRQPVESEKDLGKKQYKQMKKFAKANKLKKMALHAIAQRLSDDDIAKLQAQFKTLDANRDGCISLQELQDGLEKAGLSRKLAEKLSDTRDAMDVNNDRSIHITEFLAATLEKKHLMEEEVCWHAFHMFDRDGNGAISKNELALVLHNSDFEAFFSTDTVAQVLADTDKDQDGTISFEEFVIMVRGEVRSEEDSNGHLGEMKYVKQSESTEV
eukprot:gnl/TRDRNA2_/TRDRNA2_32606_c0_seq1.p1 gnl/TRDRNA2_/TRDRNA2_32606_c0~~gnl/TRDRNA2_/TRDRNA2_32606_c0_seq1.p1  ORF type:complete len:579 (-),score=140.82 gnl/TRDRNA2_/TRDRNA2_32606_c0_seq1:180-1916(-)